MAKSDPQPVSSFRTWGYQHQAPFFQITRFRFHSVSVNYAKSDLDPVYLDSSAEQKEPSKVGLEILLQI